MIIESIVLGVSAVFVSSLWLANIITKRQRDEEIEDGKPEPEPPAIDKFIRIVVGTPCPKCGEPARNEVRKKYPGYQNYSYVESAAAGPAIPKACSPHKGCPADKLPHLHASCYTCNYKWFMRPADYVEKEKPKSDLELFDEILKRDEKCQQDTHSK